MAIADAMVFLSPWGLQALRHMRLGSSKPPSPQRFTAASPERLIGDRAYDSDPLDQKLQRQGVKLIAPHKYNRRKPRTQHGRELRCYCRRWKIERLFAWLHNLAAWSSAGSITKPTFSTCSSSVVPSS
jgi:IS5 family transposase